MVSNETKGQFTQAVLISILTEPIHSQRLQIITVQNTLARIFTNHRKVCSCYIHLRVTPLAAC